jgi:EAL domain-containing protein (putative c-di-GMP-specific phosphodiesterase class I)
VLLEDLRRPSAAPGVALRLLGAVGATPAGSDGDDGSGRDARAGLAFGDLLRSSDELLWRAEQAVCAAREQDQPALVLFQSPLERSVRRHSTLARDLRDALEAGSRSIERGILRVLYQPQVEIATRRVVGVEALVRWWDPAHGEVPPESFIAVAEDVGLIADLDALVLRQTMTDALAWGFDHLPLAVNVSGVELQDPGYADRVIDLLRSSGDGRLRLELEITERVAIEPSSPAGANVARLRAAGVGVSIDDFGTGPAAFTTLRAVAASRIKIDRSFIADIAAGEVRAVAAIVAMARGLGLETIAEGVETPEQCALLVEHGCLVGQGYLFAPPIAAADLVRFVEQAGTSLVGVPVRRAADAGAAHA